CSSSAAVAGRSRCGSPERHRHRCAVRTAPARACRPPLLPTSAAGTAACSAARSFPASPRSGLTPRPTRCSSSPQAVSPSVRALIAPEVLLANRRLHRPFSFTRFLTLPRAHRASSDSQAARLFDRVDPGGAQRRGLEKTPGGAGGAGGRVPLARGALLREPSLAGLPLTPTVHVPMWRGTPATIELMGRVPTPELKDTVLRIVRDEAARIRSDVQIEDRLSVVPTMARVA